MAAEKKGQTIVIKKIFITAGGHGGAWKVALADFMTAMMAFFLVMWLLNQTPETKKTVSDYFSTPSLIEYQFQNFGVELTLEKLFLDLVNEPLKALQSFMEPMDKNPNVLDFGSQKMATAFMADKLGDIVAGKKNIDINASNIDFDIVDDKLFQPGTAEPLPDFPKQMERIVGITSGLQDSIVRVESRLFHQSVPSGTADEAGRVAQLRLDVIIARIQSGIEHPTVDLQGSTQVVPKKNFKENSPRPKGLLHFSIEQKAMKANGEKAKPMKDLFGKPEKKSDVYQSFIHQISAKPLKLAPDLRKEAGVGESPVED